MKKKVISLILALCMVFTMLPAVSLAGGNTSGAPYPVTGGNIYLMAGDSGYVIVGADNSVTAAVIPAEIYDAAVVAIADSAFSGCTNLTSVTLPAGLMFIDQYAFSGCRKLASVTLPAGLMGVGQNAFYECPDLVKVLYTGSETDFFSIIGYNEVPYANDLYSLMESGGDPHSVDPTGEGLYCSCTPYAGTGGNIYCWELSDGEAAIISADPGLSAISIPAQINNKPVSSIGFAAFANCTSLSSVTLPDTLKTIGNYAFLKCSSLSSVTLPDTLKTIGDSAFANCTSLSSVTLPEGLTNIGSYAFNGCKSLESVDVPSTVTSIGANPFGYCTSLKTISVAAGSTAYESDDGILFSKNKEALIQYPAAKTDTSYVMPAAVKTIGDGAFSSCGSLESVTIPKGVTTIGYAAFAFCTGLKAVTLPYGVTLIGERAFDNCIHLASVILPRSITYIRQVAFKDCPSISEVKYGGSEADWNNITIERTNTYLTGAPRTYNYDPERIPYAVTGGNIYFDMTTGAIVGADDNITAAAIPAEIENTPVTAIGENAFADCSIESVMISEGVTTIGKKAFGNCRSLVFVFLPSSLESIENYAFKECSSIHAVRYAGSESDKEGITIGSTGNGAMQKPWMYSCRPYAATGGNIYYNVSNGAASIVGAEASVTAADIPAKIENVPVTAIGDYAFEDCLNLLSAGIPEGVSYIGSYAFANSFSLSTVAMPSTVTFIGSNAFSASGLHFVYYGGSESDWSEIEISSLGNSNLQNARKYYSCLSYAATDGNIYYSISNDEITITGSDAGITAADIPAEIENVPVTAIGEDAFNGRCSLSTVTLAEGIVTIGDNAFFDCVSLSSVTIPEGTETIGYSAFCGCTVLSSVTIPEGVTSIDVDAFGCCESLETVILPSSLSSIGAGAFDGCDSLAEVFYGGSETQWNALLLNVGTGNDALIGAQITYNYDPTSIPYAVSNGNIYFDMTTGAIVGADAGVTAADIPEMIANTPVTAIGSRAFYDCRNLESVTIPGSVESIGDYAFYGCRSLLSVAVPEGVTAIGGNAFAGCTSLMAVALPLSLESIGAGAFEGFVNIVYRVVYYAGDESDLENISISDGNYDLFNALIFYSCIPYAATGGNIYFNVSNGAASIVGADLNVKAADIPAAVDGAAVTSIDEGAFFLCTLLETVTLPVSITEIGGGAFEGCGALATVYYGGTGTQWNALLDSIGDGNGALTGARIICNFDPTSIPYAVSNGNIHFNMTTGAIVGADEGITAAVIPEEIANTPVTAIGRRAFGGCDALTSVTIPEGVTTIAEDAFEGCVLLKSVFLPLSLNSINSYAFAACNALSAVYYGGARSDRNNIYINPMINDPLANTEWYYSCLSYAATDGNIYYNVSNDEITIVGADASVTAADIPSSIDDIPVTAIGGRAFGSRASLSSVTIPEGVTTIDYNAFGDCTSLETVTLPASLTFIEDYAFNGCSSLETVNYGGTGTQWTALLDSIGSGNDALTGAQTINFTQAPAPATYTVKFTDTDGTAFANIDDQEVEAGGKAQKPADPQKDGVTFAAWYNGDTEYSFDTPVNSDITLTATWRDENAPEYLGAVNLTATVEGNTIVLTWDAVDGADAYRIYKQAGGTAWSAVVKSTDELTYIDGDVTAGVTYRYTARAAKTGENFVKNPDQTTVTIAMPGELEALGPVEFTATASGKTVVLEWTAVTGADAYRIYREAKGSVWEVLVKSTDGTSYIDDTVSMGVKYYYTMRAGRYNKFIRNENQMKTSVTVPVDLPSVPIKTLELDGSSAVLTWDAVDDAEGYRVYRKPDTGISIWDIVESDITGTTYTDTSSLASGTKYYYKVRAGAAGNYPKVAGETAKSITIP
ncbi:MAG: leucine-rich repeat protein [Clostridia bacterium]|nr:leucine-rich repeat protein [Clostridia bacterium]